MKRILICLLVTLFNAFCVYADPALLDSVLVCQPDGTKLWVYDRGDEFYNWVESTDGYVIVKNEGGVFEYATITDSRIQPSGIKVNNRQEKEPAEITYAKSQKGEVQKAIKMFSIDTRKSLTGHRTAGIPSSPVVGTRKILTILMEFSDKPFTYSALHFDSLMNYPNYSGFIPGGSVRDYYYENSYGQLAIQSTVIGPFTASYSSSYYSRPQGSTGDHSADLVVEAINLADNYGIDFSLFDGNNDGYVDCIHVVFAGNRYSVSGNGIIWPYNSAFITPISKDGKNISEFILTPELFDNIGTNINSIGTICHELGHVLGAPDFYPIGASHNVENSLGTGLWDVMAQGSNYNGGYSPSHHNPYTKTAIFQWTTPNTINASETNSIYNIPTSSQNSTAIYRISTSTTGEYYLLENRQKISFDRYLQDSGLLIYHIHGNIENAIVTNTVNSNLPQMCYLVDPKSSIAIPSNTDTTSYGAAALNIFPSNHIDGPTNIFFSSQTNPRSQSWVGVSTGVNVCFIQHDGNNIKFVVNPQIEGSSQFCDTAECYIVTNVPVSCTHSWSISSNFNPGDTIASGNGTSSICIREKNGYIPMREELLSPNLPRSVIRDTIRDSNDNKYIVSKSIYDPSPKPTVSASNTTTNWTVGTTRTFTITNCSSVSFSNLQWIIKKTVYPLFGNPTIYTDTIYGKYMTYTPTWTSGATSITIDITATNLARHCEDNYVHLSYNVIRKHLLNAIDNGSLLDVTISDEETTSLLKQTTSNEKNLYTLELWHPIYGQMRKQPAYSTNEQININGLPQGTYILLLKKDYEIIAQTKVIIQ